MDYKHKSGAQKRKERKKKLGIPMKKSRTLFELGLQITGRNANSDETSTADSAGPAVIETNSEDSDVHVAGPSSKDDSSQKTDDEAFADTSGLKGVTENSKEKANLSSEISGSSHETMNDDLPTLVRDIDKPDTVALVPVISSDLGNFHNINCICAKDIESLVKIVGPPSFPKELPRDGKRAFPRVVLDSKLANGETVPRDWLSWSESTQSLHCFPCRLFSSVDIPDSKKSVLMTRDGWKKEYSWRKLYDKLPNHERSTNHSRCYMKWREMERSLKKSTDIASRLDSELIKKTQHWKELLQRILSVVLLLAERGLPFRGESSKIGDTNNGNFLGILELLSKYDPLLREHVTKVRQSQEEGKRLQAHYLSPESQNDFIEACSARVTQAILEERKRSKYFGLLADATPDMSHTEQTTFVLRYVLESETEFKIAERFLCFVDCNKKTGKDIANLIVEQLVKYNIPLDDCRGQGYDNGANMAGLYNGAQAIISKINPLALFSNCGAHSLNLCGANAAECCEEAITFFGMVQKTYNFFVRSPQRWEILEKHIGCSLHSTSQTRWSARVDSVKPFAKHSPLIKKALNECKTLNLSAECKTDLNGIMKYLNSFKCVLMATIWLKVLVSVDLRNKLLQSRDAPLDVEVANIENLVQELKSLRNQWDKLLVEAKLVADNGDNMNSDSACETTFPVKRVKKIKLAFDESEDTQIDTEGESREESVFRINVFYKLMDSVIGGLTERFEVAKTVNNMFQCLWDYQKLDECEIDSQCSALQAFYPGDLGLELSQEVQYLKSIHECNLGSGTLKPLKLLNKLKELKLGGLFPNVCIAIRIFCTIPVTVAEAERSFSKMKLIKNVLRSTMGQQRMSSLTLLAIESDIAKKISYEDIINDFATKKARRML